jgi:hypothetical protein
MHEHTFRAAAVSATAVRPPAHATPAARATVMAGARRRMPGRASRR